MDRKELGLPTRLSELKKKVEEEDLGEVAKRLLPIVDSMAWFKPIETEEQLLDFIRLAY